MASGSYRQTVTTANPPTPPIDGSGSSSFSEKHQALNRLLDAVACVSQEAFAAPEGDKLLLEATGLLEDFIAANFGSDTLVRRH